MKKTFIALVIICVLAVFLTGCTGRINDNVVPDTVPAPYVSPYASPYDMVPDVSPYVPGYGYNGNPVSPGPQITP